MKCTRCKKVFDVDKNPGGLVYGVPTIISETVSSCIKIHLCSSCSKKIVNEILNHSKIENEYKEIIMKPPETPNCDKLAAEDVQNVKEFLLWLEENGFCIKKFTNETQMNIKELWYLWANVDSKALENERKSLLKYQRELNKKL